MAMAYSIYCNSRFISRHMSFLFFLCQQLGQGFRAARTMFGRRGLRCNGFWRRMLMPITCQQLPTFRRSCSEHSCASLSLLFEAWRGTSPLGRISDWCSFAVIFSPLSPRQEVFAGVFNLGPSFQKDGSQFDKLFADGETFKIGELSASVMYNPWAYSRLRLPAGYHLLSSFQYFQ